MTALAARGIRKSFGRHRVRAGLDLEIAAGEMVAVVGENGNGKSALLRILAGDLRPDAGRVAIRGRPGYCPQAVVLDDALTVDRHVRYFQAAHANRRTEPGRGADRPAGIRRVPGPARRRPVRRDQPEAQPGSGHMHDLAVLLWTAGTATLVITHLVFEEARFDRICHLRSGRIEEEARSHAPAA